MLDGLHAVMLVGAGVHACCSLGSRRSRSVGTVVSTGVMVAAMLDASFTLLGVAPLVWTLVLLGWGMVCAAALRRRRGAGAAAHPGGILHVHHLVGLTVTAGQLSVHGTMGDGTGGHAHSVSVLLLVAGAGAVLFTGWSVVLVAAARRTGLERGTLVGMSLMTVAMGLMPFA